MSGGRFFSGGVVPAMATKMRLKDGRRKTSAGPVAGHPVTTTRERCSVPLPARQELRSGYLC